MCKKSMMLAVCLCALFIGQSAFAYLIVEDTFTQTETRLAGGALDGTFTEVGNREWYNRPTSDHYVFNDPDGIPGNADDNIKRTTGTTYIWVSLVDYVPAPAGETFTVSGDFYFPDAATAQDGALVFYPTGTNVSGSALNLDSCTFAVRIYNQLTDIDGNVCNARLYCWDGTTEVNLYAVIPSITDNVGVASQPLVAAYDTVTGLLNVTVNGDAVFTNLDVPALIEGWTPDIAYTGFLLRPRGSAGTFDNFRIASTVPEPATLILLSLGGLGLLRRKK